MAESVANSCVVSVVDRAERRLVLEVVGQQHLNASDGEGAVEPNPRAPADVES